MNEAKILRIIEGSAYEMSLPRKDVIAKVESYSYPLVEHLIKLLIYGKTLGEEVFNDWKDNEICGYFAYICNLTTKSGAGKLRSDDYFTAFIEHQGTNVADYASTISLFRINNRRTGQYPDFVPSNQYAHKLQCLYFDLLHSVCPLLAQSKLIDVDSSYFVPIVNEVLSRNHIGEIEK